MLGLMDGEEDLDREPTVDVAGLEEGAADASGGGGHGSDEEVSYLRILCCHWERRVAYSCTVAARTYCLELFSSLHHSKPDTLACDYRATTPLQGPPPPISTDNFPGRSSPST